MWERLYNAFVIVAAAFGLCAMMLGIVIYWRDDGDWPRFLWAIGGVTALVVIAFLGGAAVGWLDRRLRRWRETKD